MIEAGIQLISGGLGGMAAGILLPRISLRRWADFLIGIVGGGLMGLLLPALGLPFGPIRPAEGVDLGALGQSMASGAAGGAILLTLVGTLGAALRK